MISGIDSSKGLGSIANDKVGNGFQFTRNDKGRGILKKNQLVLYSLSILVRMM